MSTIRKTPSQRVSRKMPIVRRLNRFFAARPRRRASPVRRWSNRLTRSTERGISKGGEPSKPTPSRIRSEEHTSELQSPCNLVCRLLLEKKKKALHILPIGLKFGELVLTHLVDLPSVRFALGSDRTRLMLGDSRVTVHLASRCVLARVGC